MCIQNFEFIIFSPLSERREKSDEDSAPGLSPFYRPLRNFITKKGGRRKRERKRVELVVTT
jgi:hypothetical protein